MSGIRRVPLHEMTRELAATARGELPATLVVRGGTLVSVTSGEILPGMSVAVQGSRIAYVGPDAGHTVGDGTRIIEAGELRLDTKNYTAWVRGEPLSLRLKEFELLAALASEPGELKSREDLAKEVWGHAGTASSRTIDVHIQRLRATLEGKSGYEYIHTVRGVGYRLEVGP